MMAVANYNTCTDCTMASAIRRTSFNIDACVCRPAEYLPAFHNVLPFVNIDVETHPAQNIAVH
jgi:hypothetical protein